ncbi:hypothetical protein [Oleiagrimonas sp. C23AA]|uniref:hypothetical protein n=1 Tax=Oleiagrimonas sp. C23AA TaxID=2719047 RepID=UPI0014221F8C|nr:hypothetical protein [Oleiagrimonas sp. C23AA]NII10137.1 hypothetical protein [Oleiagrimonas sp. C23AA]
MNFKRLPIVLVAFSVLAASSAAYAIKMPPPPTKAELAGVWVGPDDSGAVLRLELDYSGKGSLVISNHDPRFTFKYKVILTKINIYKLSFGVKSVGHTKVGFTLSGTFHPHAIQLQRHLSTFDQTWFHNAMLLRSKSLQSGLEHVQTVSGQLPHGVGR